MRQGLANLIRESGHSNCAAYETIEDMETDNDRDLSDAMILINLGHDEEFVARSIKGLKSRHPTSQTVMLSNKYSHSHLRCAIDAGASGYILTDISCEAIIKSLEVISLGQPVIPEEALELISNGKADALGDALPSRKPTSQLPPGLLSERELEVLRCISRAMSNKLIARECNICEATVKVHVKAILRKIKGKNRTEAAIWAIYHGIEPSERQTHLGGNQLEAVSDADMSVTCDQLGPVRWTLTKDRLTGHLQ